MPDSLWPGTTVSRDEESERLCWSLYVLSHSKLTGSCPGHPDFVHIGDTVQKALGSAQDDNGVRQASVVVLGQGNVALDCARILAKGSTGLFDTDIAAHSLPVIGNGVSHVSIVGRRGHVQGAFTIKELRELVKLEEEGDGAFFSVRSDELDLGSTEASIKELDSATGRPKKRIEKLLREAAGMGEFCVCTVGTMINFRRRQSLSHSVRPSHLSRAD